MYLTKKILRSVMVGFCVFIATIIVAYVSFTSTYKKTAQTASELVAPPEQEVAAVENEPLAAEDTITAEYYLARYDGTDLSIYACSDTAEEFLYTLDVRTEDISSDELTHLRSGVRLDGKEALAAFEEDFVS